MTHFVDVLAASAFSELASSVPASSNNLGKADTFRYAAHFTRFGVRAQVISEATGVSVAEARKLYAEIIGGRPSPGPSASLARYTRPLDQHAQVCQYVWLHLAIHGPIVQKPDTLLRTWLRVCETYYNYGALYLHALQSVRPIDINLAYDIATKLAAGQIVPVRCKSTACQFPAVMFDDQGLDYICPHCKTILC